MSNGKVCIVSKDFAYIQTIEGTIFDFNIKDYPKLRNGNNVEFDIEPRMFTFDTAINIKRSSFWKRLLCLK
jgi:hypothetical protein